MALKFIALSGTVSVTENLYVYEAENQMMIVDCGVGFPDLEMRGVDLVIPDFSYIIKNKDKLKGILLSQAHEDHIGALPFLLKDVNAPLWTAPMVAEFIRDKFEEHDTRRPILNVFDPDTSEFEIGPFKIHPFRVTHSVPDTCGFAIDTPEGRIFHVPEHKIDQDPVDGMPFDAKKIGELGRNGCLFLANDCLGSNKPGITPGEREIEENLLKVVEPAKAAVYFTAISSNIGRFQQAINVAKRVGRRVAFVGRSVQKRSEIAHDLGYLKYSQGQVIPLRQARKLPKSEVMYITAGCYGQVGSSVFRLAIGEHEKAVIEEGDTMIFSADPAPPYTKESIDFVVDHFIDKGVDVHYYDLDEGLYVSGHGSQGDILELFKLTKPKYFLPIGGTIRFMHAYKRLAVEKFGANPNSVFELKPGESVEFANGNARRGERIAVKEVLVDGLGVGDVGRVVLQDRNILAQDGVVVVVLKIDREKRKILEEPGITSRGFVFHGGQRDLLKKAANMVKSEIEREKYVDWAGTKNSVINSLEKFFFEATGRHPMILPVIVEV